MNLIIIGNSPILFKASIWHYTTCFYTVKFFTSCYLSICKIIRFCKNNIYILFLRILIKKFMLQRLIGFIHVL